ncbi:hypothetical protein ACJJTC_000945 [Scirpophaga incertulas]
MVGYYQNDILTEKQKLIAGCISGIVTRFITQPLDVIKIRTQLEQKTDSKYKKMWFGISRKIIKKEGITAFYYGHNLGQIHSILAVSSQFFVYELGTKYASNIQTETLRPTFTFLCGVLAGGCSATLVSPIEVIRLRQIILQKQYHGIYNGAKTVYKHGGILAFYEGLSASLIQMGPAVGISFGVFQLLQKRLLNYLQECDDNCKISSTNPHKPGHLLISSTVAGSCAGFVSKTITYPFELVKRRLQIASHKDDDQKIKKHYIKCKGLVNCIVDTYQADGFLGLFRGWKVTIYKAQLTSVIAFTTYELACYTIRELQNFM